MAVTQEDTIIVRSGDAVALLLRVVLFQEFAGNSLVWIAQCLEHDIAAAGDSLEEAKQAFEKTLLGEIMTAIEFKKDSLDHIKPAPARFGKMWEDAHKNGFEAAWAAPEPDVKLPPAWEIDQYSASARLYGKPGHHCH